MGFALVFVNALAWTLLYLMSLGQLSAEVQKQDPGKWREIRANGALVETRMKTGFRVLRMYLGDPSGLSLRGRAGEVAAIARFRLTVGVMSMCALFIAMGVLASID